MKVTETMKEVALKVGIIENTTEIRDVSTSIMIARGCLAVNVGAENLLKAQDDIVDKCIQTKEKLYIASNILKSFSSKVWPTRSDICDAAYMIKSGIHNIIIIDPICKEYNFRYLCDSLNALEAIAYTTYIIPKELRNDIRKYEKNDLFLYERVIIWIQLHNGGFINYFIYFLMYDRMRKFKVMLS